MTNSYYHSFLRLELRILSDFLANMKYATEHIKIRKAKSKDAGLLLKLYSKEKGVSDFAGLQTKERFLSLVNSKDAVIIVAEKEGKVIGALDAEFYDESRFSYFANIVVSKKERGKGIASKLIKEYEQICKKRGIKTIVALVFDWNKKMHPIMKNKKYKYTGNLREYIKKLR